MKKKMMTDKQRIEALLNYKRPDRVPIWPFDYKGFAVIYNNLPLSVAYTDPEACYSAVYKTSHDLGWVFWPTIIYAAMGAWEFGGEIRMPSGDYTQAPMVTRYPIEKDEDVYNLKPPGPDAGIFPVARRYAEIVRQEKPDNAPFTTILPAASGFGIACNTAGVDRFLRWLRKKPDLAHYLIDRIFEWTSATLPEQSAKLGSDGILGSGSAGAVSTNSLISARQFEEFALPRLKEGQEQLRALGYKSSFVHICGEQNLNLPYWAQVDFGNPGIISVGHETKLGRAAELFPKDIIMGNLEPAIIQTATPEEVYEATRKVVEDGKKLPTGYIFSPGCELPPRSPIENIKMMNKAVDDFGWYE